MVSFVVILSLSINNSPLYFEYILLIAVSFAFTSLVQNRFKPKNFEFWLEQTAGHALFIRSCHRLAKTGRASKVRRNKTIFRFIDELA